MASSASWPERLSLREAITERASNRVIDPAAGAVYALVSKTSTPQRGPGVLRRIDLRTRSVRLGPTFGVGGITMASGYLWVYGLPQATSRPVINQVNAATLARVRSIQLAPLSAQYPGLWPSPQDPTAQCGSA